MVSFCSCKVSFTNLSCEVFSFTKRSNCLFFLRIFLSRTMINIAIKSTNKITYTILNHRVFHQGGNSVIFIKLSCSDHSLSLVVVITLNTYFPCGIFVYVTFLLFSPNTQSVSNPSSLYFTFVF